jgi:hypothetical protein
MAGMVFCADPPPPAAATEKVSIEEAQRLIGFSAGMPPLPPMVVKPVERLEPVPDLERNAVKTGLLPSAAPPPPLTDEEKAGISEDEFRAAIADLPDKAQPSVEMDWIRSHPAMTRLARQPNKMKGVVITAEDVLISPCGKAPSRSAVFSLQHWANYPHEFFKQVLSQDKKSDSVANQDTKEELSIKEVKKLLAGIQHREHVE